MEHEDLIAEPISGKKPVKIELDSSDKLGDLGDEQKERHQGQIKSYKVSLIERKDLDDGFGMKISDKWKLFKEAGLPVVPTLRRSQKGTLLMTDVTADGSEIYGKNLSKKLEQLSVDNKASEETKLADEFLKILSGPELDKIKSQLNAYKEIANSKGICLPLDDPFELVVHPDGRWQLVILDLKYGGGQFKKYALIFEEIYNVEVTTIYQINTKLIDNFLSHLMEIKKNIQLIPKK
jgi:hypothetical protein